MKKITRGTSKKVRWGYGALAFVFILAGASALSTTETSDKNQMVNTIESSESYEETVVSNENIESSDTSLEVSVEEPLTSDMEVHFIDVGQGDATLIKADGHYMLIDAGGNNKGTAVQLYLKNQGVEKLDYLILTHTDADHIGGADVIVSKFDIENILIGDFQKDSASYEELLNAIEYRYMDYSVPEVGSEYPFGNASFTIIAPNGTYDNPDDSSIAFILKNGDNTFLFSGDCEGEAEADILANNISIDCDVYKLGHHGSSTSSSQAFLEAMSPVYGVISCGEGNSYGHPHAEPLNNLRAMGVKVFRTDEQGSVIAYSDGTEITWNCAPSESWKSGESTQNADENTPKPDEGTQNVVVSTQNAATEMGATTGSESANDSSENSSSTTESSSNSSAAESAPSEDTGTGAYAVNNKNGKIHIVGACSATDNGKNAMKEPIYFDTYEQAEAYSSSIEPELEKRKCGNCW